MRVSLPIATHADNIDVILLDVALLLLPAALGDYEVYVPNGLEHFFSDLVGVEAHFALEGIELVGRQGDDEIISQLRGLLKKPDVTVVQQVECAIGENASKAGRPRGFAGWEKAWRGVNAN